jgi:hypothetical protein
MKHFFGFIGGILAAAIAGLLVVVFQAPISRQFSADRLTAEVQAGLWVPIPARDGDLGKLWKDRLGPYALERLQTGEEMYSSDWVVENKGAKKVDSIKVDFLNAAPEIIYIIQDGKLISEIKDPKTISLPPLNPGGSLRVYLVSIFDTREPLHYGKGWLKTFSSEGPVSFHLSSVNVQAIEDPIENFIETWILPSAIFALILLVLILFFTSAHFMVFSESIIKDVLIYRREKKRYDSAPSSYDYSIKKS